MPRHMRLRPVGAATAGRLLHTARRYSPCRSLVNTLNVLRRRLAQLQGSQYTKEDLAHFQARPP